MPWTVKSAGNHYDIVKKIGNGKIKVVGHSKTKAKAQASVRARYASTKMPMKGMKPERMGY